ncbi:MAG: protein kinase [Candidatus Competibacteraceae bacterium]
MHIPGYQIERELGQGGMAIVYLALQESLHRHVALKVIKPILTTDEEFAQRFLREGRIIAQLSNPHIVTVYDIAAHDNTYYLSMEYLSGGTLQQRIREGLPLEEALPIARAIASALNYAHHRGIIHRDIKPQNILFRDNDTPVLTDFGIAKTLGSTTVMTRTGLSLGTPRYMSPEQIRGQPVDARADLYSFGVLFHEMLTGNVPFIADDSFALAMMHVTAPVPKLPSKLSRFQPLLDRLLDKDPNQRFQTGQEFVAALDVLEKAPIELLAVTGPSPQISSATPPARRFGWKSGALAATLAGAVLAGGYWFVHRPAPPPVVSTPTRPPEPSAVDLAAQRRAEADSLLAQARQEQQAGALEDSLPHIEQGLKLVPDHPALLALREEVGRQLAEGAARKAREEQQIQAQLLAEQSLDQAQRARQEGTLGLSLVHIEQGLQAVPNHPGLLAMRQEVLAQQAELKRQEEAARRLAEAAERQRIEAERQRAEAEQRRRKADEQLARALDSQRNRAYETSLLQIEQGLQQIPDHSRLLALREEVRGQLREAKAAMPPEPAAETAKIAALLRECDAYLKANKLTSRKGGNAVDCYGEVLKRDRGNAEAREGLDRIADRYADQSASAIQRGDTAAARGSIDRLARLNPAHPRLRDLREQLTRVETATKSAPLPTEPPEEPVETPIRPPSQPPTARPEPSPQPGVPPIDLVSIPQSAEQPPTQPPEPSAKPGTAEQAWAAIRNSSDPAEIEQFLATYPKSRQASAARARLKELQQPQQQQQQSASAQLMVRANVEDAEISINGRKVGTVPMQIEMKPGSYQVRVSREGYSDWNGKVNLTAGNESTLQIVLPKKLEVATAPPAGARPIPDSTPEPAPAKSAVPEPAPPPRPPEPQTAATTTPGSDCIRGNCQNGEGTYRYPDGSEYTGDFRNAKMHGQGTYLYAGRGEKYVGEWRNGAIDGQGTYYYRSGNRYSGSWRSGKKSGQGTYLYANGDKYVGEFASDQPNGQGTYYYRNGDRYEGEWHNGRKHGQGIMYENGQKIVGEWQNDQKVRVTVQQ